MLGFALGFVLAPLGLRNGWSLTCPRRTSVAGLCVQRIATRCSSSRRLVALASNLDQLMRRTCQPTAKGHGQARREGSRHKGRPGVRGQRKSPARGAVHCCCCRWSGPTDKATGAHALEPTYVAGERFLCDLCQLLQDLGHNFPSSLTPLSLDFSLSSRSRR